MRVYYSDDTPGYWVPGAAVVVAPDEEMARRMVEDALIEHGLRGQDFTLVELDQTRPAAVVICNGDY